MLRRSSPVLFSERLMRSQTAILPQNRKRYGRHTSAWVSRLTSRKSSPMAAESTEVIRSVRRFLAHTIGRTRSYSSLLSVE